MIREVLTLSRLRAMPAEEAAALWTVRLADGEFPHERTLFDEWLQLDEANRAAWERTQDGWAVFDHAAADELLDAMRRHARAARPTGRERWSRYAAVAALFLAVTTGSLVADRIGLLGHGGDEVAGSKTEGPSAPLVYASGRELPRLVTLPDGSRMTLDADTRVAAIFRQDRRSLEILKGRAFFSVQHDASRPFLVRARNLEVSAIGTRFDVRIAGPLIQVLLAEGRLSVTTAPPASKPLIMSAGQQLTAVGGASPALSRADTGEAMNWQKGFATFDDDTLAEAAAELNRYPGDRLVIRDRRVAELRITGMFRAGDAERFARTLEQVYPVRVVRSNSHELEIVPAS